MEETVVLRLDSSLVSTDGRWGVGLRRGCSIASMAVVFGMACHERPMPPATRTTIRLTTGTPGAGFHPLGQALAAQYGQSLPDIKVEVRESAGSVSNVEALQQGSADIGFAFADVAYMAFSGRLSAGSSPFDRLRGMAVLQLTPLHIVVRGGSTINDIAGLRGRRVGLGPPGSGTALTASMVLQAFGIGTGDVRAESLRFNEASTRLIAGTLDAMFVNASYPAESVRSATGAGARLLTVGGPAIERLRHEYPFLRPTVIPAGTYPRYASPIRTIGSDTLLVCRSDLDEATVYRLTKAFFDVLPALVAEQESLRLMDLEEAPATPIRLHEGAARYYRERELSR